MYRDFGPRKSRSTPASRLRRFKWFRQGIAEHNLKNAEKQAFFVTLRRLAGHHGRLPDSMIVAERIEDEDRILASGGFADIRRGSYMGHFVAVKTLRVSKQDDFLEIRKVSIDSISRPSGTRSQPSFSSDFAKKLFSGTRYPIRTS
jgi:hypothetical protein